jgi:hypothetical protein
MATRTLTRKLPKGTASGSKRRASPANLFRSEPEADKPYATGSNAPTTGELKLEVSIGRRVRVLRQRLQLTATDLAAQAALSPGMLSKIRLACCEMAWISSVLIEPDVSHTMATSAVARRMPGMRG